jgi:diguanylate cyclase (GGDEF)-like protein
VRGSDIACRYGGEEFVLVLAGATLDDARRRAEQICSAIGSEQIRFGGVTASLGIALYPEHAVDTEALLRAADRALYEAKAAGRNRVQVFVGPAGRAES